MKAPDNVQAFYKFITEREQIRLRKESGLPRPWTEDPILAQYKFTNVRRHNDWTSRQLRETYYTPNFDAPREDILMNCALARYFGTFEFMDSVGWQTWKDFNFDMIERRARDRLFAKMKVFTGAYVITNQGMSLPKEEVVVRYFLSGLHAAVPDIVDIVQKTRNWQKTADRMRGINGFGGSGFMTKEVLLDTTYTSFWFGDDHIYESPDFSYPKDWDTWTPIGPGARRGILRILGYNIRKPPKITEKMLLEYILKIRGWQTQLWGYGQLSPTDIQFQLCEFDKYERVRFGQGRPRNKYTPRS